MTRYRLAIFELFALVLALGLLASYMVYQSVQEVSRSSEALVERSMADLQGLDAFRTDLLEHERLAYEAYGAIQPDALADRQAAVAQRIKEQWSRLSEWGLGRTSRKDLETHWSAIRTQTNKLYANLSAESTDWDAARAQLEAITEHRRAMTPTLEDLATSLQAAAREANKANQANLAFLNRMVVLYTAAIFFIAIGVGLVFLRILRLNRENRALAEFPARNPNPVLKLGPKTDVRYANPAADELARSLAASHTGEDLLDSATHQAIADDPHARREAERGDRRLLFEWDWLPDLGTYHVYARDITEQRRAEESLRRMAYEDGVTGLPNREGLLAALADLCASERPAVIIVSLERFDRLVAQSGFQEADALLARVGQALQEAAQTHWGENVLVGRLDGALFGVVVPEGEAVSPAAVEALRAELPREMRTPHALFQTEYRTGIRRSEAGEDQPEAEALLRDANTALIAADQDSAVRVVDHDRALQEAEEGRGRIEACLRDALREERGLELYIQPKLRLSDGAISGGEFLVRWQDPDLGRVSPGDFIPVAEQSGLILDLGQWILDRAADYLADWQADPDAAGMQAAVNVAAPELYDAGWAEGVLDRLRARDLPGHLLEVEVTERVLAGTKDSPTLTNLHRLREAGVSIAVDDFGTGYSSLGYIHRLPIDRVKVDKQFVDPLPVAADSISLARVVVEMADGLGLTTIAEGVEHGEQADALRAMGATFVQGFLYTRPLPAADFPERIRSGKGA